MTAGRHRHNPRHSNKVLQNGNSTPVSTEGAEVNVIFVDENSEKNDLLEVLIKGPPINSDDFKRLVQSVDNLDIVAKVFLLEGTPFVFSKSPMKYMIFREQVAEKFEVGYQDVCIVGSAKLGYSPSPQKYGKDFADQSDVDVVIISETLFDGGSLNLFKHLNHVGPPLHKFGFGNSTGQKKDISPVKEDEWKNIKEGIRNYVYQNFNPALLPNDDLMRIDIFKKITSTSPLFMALEPAVFVSKIRCRIFRNWKSAEDYYTNTLRQLRNKFEGDEVDYDPDSEEVSSQPSRSE